MATTKIKSVYICSECGFQSARPMGKCPSCGAWNSMEEQEILPEAPAAPERHRGYAPDGSSRAEPFDDLTLPEYMRKKTGSAELDRVLGGGVVQGSVVLLAGEPGIGKSTLLLQICRDLGGTGKVLYVSGEESKWQLKYRAKRLEVFSPDLYVLTETNIERILEECARVSPGYLIIDSIQTVFDPRVASAPGSVSQVRESTLRVLTAAKSRGISVILVGHVNKEGGIAGPKVLEHMVDAVLYFEGDRQNTFRIIRAVKNRYGATGEIGVFEMTDKGLAEVPNPSKMLLTGRPKGISGNCAVCLIEGSRPLIAELQALTVTSVFPSPKRTVNGVDYNRAGLILAVLERRLGLRFSTLDVYLNVVGGLRIDEPASDLPLALALVSSLKDKPIGEHIIAFGEIGLAGETRPVSQIEARVKEAVRLGFTEILLPKGNIGKTPIPVPEGVTLRPVRSIYDALAIFG
ncbi:MAG: DNA repair protein RadA [Clostridia bacterium]|nr:DNA repair protein RadA [Clostridia bacterium]